MRAKTLGALAVCALLGLTAAGVRAGESVAPPDAPRTVAEPGQVEAAEQANLFAKITGYAESVQVGIGDHVKKGDVLAVLAAPELDAELRQKTALLEVAKVQVEQSKRSIDASEAALEAFKAHLEGAQADVKHARAQCDYRKTELKRLEELESAKSIDVRLVDEKRHQADAAEAAAASAEAVVQAAKADVAGGAAKVEAARADVQVAEARVVAALAKVQRAEVVLGYTKLRAPFNGVVTRRAVDPGAFVGPPAGGKDSPLFVVARVDSVRVVVAVPETDAVRLKVGARAVVRLDALKGQEFKGKVSRTAGAIDPKTRLLRVEIDLPNPDEKLMPGMYGTVVITPDEGAPPKGAPDKPNGQSHLLPILPPGASAPVVLPLDPTAAGVGVEVRSAEVRSALGQHLQAAEPGADKDEAGLKKALVEAAKSTYQEDLARLKNLQASSPEDLYVWSRRWLDAEVDLAGNKEERVAAHQRHLDRMKDLERRAKAMAAAGQGRQSDATAGTYYRTQAELWLTRAQGQ